MAACGLSLPFPGCAYDITDIDVGGVTVTPKSVAIAQAPACPWTCYLPTPFGNCNTGNAPGHACTFPLLNNASHAYTVPINAELNPNTEGSTCFANEASETPLSYSQDVWHNSSHHGFFHSSSTKIHWYYHMHVKCAAAISKPRILIAVLCAVP